MSREVPYLGESNRYWSNKFDQTTIIYPYLIALATLKFKYSEYEIKQDRVCSQSVPD